MRESSELSPPIEDEDARARLRLERRVLLTVALGGMLAPLNSTMIAVALPRLMEVFEVGVGTASWLVTAYLIGMACLQPISGKLGDRLGRRSLILGGLIYFGLVSLGAALATGFWVLLFFRVQQAMAAAVVAPNGMALVREIVPAHRRAGRFGLISAAISLAAALGPPLGGLLVQVADWDAIFYVNLVFILPALLLGRKVLPSGRLRSEGQRFDLGGAVVMLVLLSSTAWLLIRWRETEADSLAAIGGLLLIAAAVFFLRYELRQPDPVFEPRFFLHRSFAAATGAVALSNLAMYCTLLAIPVLMAGKNWTSIQTGSVLMALTATSMVVAPLGGRLADLWGRRWPSVAGLSVLTASLLPFWLSAGELPVLTLVVCLGGAGIGLGLSWAGLQTGAVETVGPRQAGAAAGIYATSRYLGSIVGSSLLAGMLGSAEGDGFSMVFLMVVVGAGLSVLVSLRLEDRPQPRGEEGDDRG